MPETLPTSVEVKQIPLSQIRPSQNNPRVIITQEMIDSRAASMTEVGQTTPITLMPLTPEERETSGECLYEIIDGELRYRAALKLGRTAIDALVTPMSHQEAYKRRIGANRSHKPIWFEDYLAMETLVNAPKGPDKMQKQEVAALFEVDNAKVSRAMRILNVLNLASRALVFENLKNGQQTWEITENALFRLTDLDSPDAVESALRVVLDKQMTEPQAKALVASIKTGTPAHEHMVAPKAPKRTKAALPPELASQVVELPAGFHSEPAQPSHVPQHAASAQASATSPTTNQMNTAGTGSASGTGTTKASASAGSLSTGETVLYDTLAGVSIIAKIKTKLKKGEKPTTTETLLLAGHGLWSILAWVGKHGFKLAKAIGKELWRVSKDAIKITLRAVGRTVRNVLAGLVAFAVLGIIVWLGYDILIRGFHPRAALMDIGKTLVEWAILLWKAG